MFGHVFYLKKYYSFVSVKKNSKNLKFSKISFSKFFQKFTKFYGKIYFLKKNYGQTDLSQGWFPVVLEDDRL